MHEQTLIVMENMKWRSLRDDMMFIVDVHKLELQFQL